MNDDFNKNDDNEVVDSVPNGARQMGEDDSSITNNHSNYNDYGTFHTRVIYENAPLSLFAKIAIVLSLLSILFFCYPIISFVFAGISILCAFICIFSSYSGKVISIFAIFLSIVGGILAMFSSIIILFFDALIR